MSVTLEFACLSLGVAVDQQTGSLSVFDVLEEMRAPQVPFQIPTLVISMIFLNHTGQKREGSFDMEVLDSEGNRIKIGQGQLSFPPSRKRMKAVLRMGAFPIHHFGEQKLFVKWQGEGVGFSGEQEFGFEAIQMPQVAQGSPQAQSSDETHH
ncbi:MAG: hypothetical protein CL678_11305 [Bdellovibrionaceae bacterium]|nr:hypothetical protein [Pseudobdellovibrionaceae bacterium]|tara:strand:- start:440 stop:895 length:456 start_codon:yes stop_codon:yes gene_type:complete